MIEATIMTADYVIVRQQQNGSNAADVARVAPTTMIFIPAPAASRTTRRNSTSFDECAAGAQVLLNAVL